MPQFPDASNPLADDCRRCPALAESRECISWGNGPLDATVLVVGEAPGAGDSDADRWRGGNWTGMAYTSRHSGRRVRAMLADAGFGPDDCYFTNAVKCFPADDADGTTNREPTPEERANCRPYLREEIETVGPDAVVATGKHATQSVLAMVDRELDGFLDTVLDPIPCPALETTLVPVLHPSYQDVWVPRIDHTPESYRAALAATLDAETVA
ncbi:MULTISPECIES: uracil-DNA glycosylase [Salinibaculum]|uniref:uracil-DNA glycosylase n=1 Tax=Salinibaculum TaxID=2732368 RepID=UPI0030D4119F